MTESSTAQIERPPAGTYRIDPANSEIGYSGKHRFGTGTVHATFTIKSGEIRVADPITGSGVAVTVDAASFKSNSARRDKDVRGARLLDIARYPEITFASDRLREEGDHWVVSGTVTAHGETVPVDVTIDRVTREGAAISIHGRAQHLDRYALGVTRGKGMVGRFLDLEINAHATPA